MENSLPADIINFAQAKILLRSILILPQLNETNRDFADLQSGYSSHSEGRQDSWFLIAQNHFRNLFIIDAHEKEQGYPIYFVQSGRGSWKREKIADNFQDFKIFLEVIAYLLQNNPEEVITKIQNHNYAHTHMWKEAIDTLIKKQIMYEKEEEAEQSSMIPINIINFAKAEINLEEILALPQLNETHRDFVDLQSGYRFDDVKNISLIDGKKGSWQDSWFVIAQNYFADTFIIDAHEKEQGYPIYFAPAGAGCWKLEKVADNFENFKYFLEVIADLLKNNPQEIITEIQSNAYAHAEIWQETIQTIEEE